LIGSNNLFGLSFKRSLVKKLPIAYVHNQSMFKKNIWLESQMIHVALFSFQRTTLSFEALASSDSFIVPHLFQAVKNFFTFLFCLKGGRPA
jgi:hypothetical protein